MSARESRWNELQDRFAQGERLSAEEERERLAYAEQNALAARELALFAALRARASAPDPAVSASLIAGALDGVRSVPRLRLVKAHDLDLVPRAPTTPAGSSRRLLVAASALLIGTAAAIAVVLAKPSDESAAVATAPRVAPPTSPARAELVLSAGQVDVEGQPSRVGQRLLAEGERVSTAEGRACITIDPGIDICLAKQTAIRLESLKPKSIRVSVAAGTALAALTRREAGATFALLAGEVSATAHGTTYAVRRSREDAEVMVLEGAVEVARGDNRELVDAHSRVVVPAQTAAFARTTIGRSEEARLLTLRAAHRLWIGAAVGVLELSSAPSVGQASVDEEAALPLPLQAFVAAGTHRVGWRDTTGTESTSWVEITAGETRRLTPPEPAKSAPNEPTSQPSAAALLERARRELARAQPRQALVLYEQLRATYPASTEARTVLVTMGKLELDLGQPKRALGYFEAYQRGGGALMPEALAGRARALRALGRSHEERQAIQRYLAAYPKAFDAPSFGKRLHELLPP